MLKSKFASLFGLTLLGLMAAPYSQGQGLGNSPYSRLGLGDFNPNTGGVRQQGMGGVGLAAPNGINVNELNPALVYYTSRTTYEVGVNGEFKTIRNQVNSQRDGNGSLSYLAFSVPISKRWAGAAGLKPYSSVNYLSTVREPVPNDPNGGLSYKEYKGEGGLSEAYIVQAFQVAKGLSLGVTASYVFGNIDLTTGTSVAPADATSAAGLSKVIIRERVRYSDFTFRTGAHYRGKVNSKLNYNLAGVYSFQSNLNGKRDTSLEREDAAGLQTENTTLLTNQKGEATVPAMEQFGIGFDNNKNWSINFDLSRQEWSKFRAFGLQGGTVGIPLSNTFRAGLGGEFAPDPSSVSSYFKRVTYRAGISVAELPYRPAGERLYDRSVSWGFAFPLPTATVLDNTTINLAFTYGQRGNTKRTAESPNGNVKEDYVRMQLGVTLNNRWFIKRRIE
ncbi:OmpP1/FadL family transporter [Hymenobacter jejuensis]|uniref:Aromatic hydrocarbon degradation protein n=1 Tax=Hymenobacter jejuensis TaxID=2502781 RepID=A0A5B7ZY10_9BACT|nr:outer membrane protein transport protein [Hymenobacter jejuensis]QDA60064.1 hypothetical protein FHG12_08055 [Hymenobacter jejuensis]